ncbi:MAG: carbohydrate-binding domain-containing protein [Acidimicrobiales bacterium]
MNKHTMRALALVTALAVLAGCGTTGSATVSDQNALGAGVEDTTSEGDASSTEDNVEPHAGSDSYDYDESDVVDIALGSEISASSDAVTIDGTTATITSAGAYEITGTLTDGQILVDAGDGAVVEIILNGADITNADGAAIAVMSAETAIVILADGTSNTLTDGATYVLAEGEDEPNATLFSKTDLTLAGAGSLTVVGNYDDGVASKDGLVIISGDITVDAVDDGIRGRDYVVVEGGDIEVTAGGDGIKSDNDEDPERGYIAIADGVIDVTSADDGLQAATDALVTGGTLEISAGATGTSDDARGIQGDVMVAIGGGTITADAVDDAVHSNSTVTIDGGDLTLASGDDAIHGDSYVTINGGSILITESFEGIESEIITINDGFVDITSDDDGLNVASADAETANTTTQPAPGGGRGGGAPVEAVGENYIYINGGTTAITITGALAEQGDGIDANGHVEMTGGVVAVSGPTDTRNSALDYSGGTFTMTGGLFVGTNIDGRNSEGVGAGSTQASLYLTFGSVIDAGTLIHIRSTSGDSLVTFEPANRFDVVVFSSPDLVAGETYEIYLGGTVDGDSPTGLHDTYSPGEPAGTATAA